jgi:hypothetical protein
MTAEELKQKIRSEIERRIKRENEILWNAKLRGTFASPSCEYNLLTLTSLRDFIDSLPDETNKTLEEAAEEYADENCSDYAYRNEYDASFIAGAEWQKEQMMEMFLYAQEVAGGDYQKAVYQMAIDKLNSM